MATSTPPDEDFAPLVIVGAPRSGTTWLLDILSSHPAVLGVFESWMFTGKLGVGAMFDQPQWHPTFADHQVKTIGRTAGLAQLISRERLRADVRAMITGWLRSAAREGQRFFVLKELGTADIPTITEIFPRARFVHIVRDGRDVVLSQRAAAKSWAPEMASLRHLGIFSRARKWRADVRTIRWNLAATGNPSFQVRYEDLSRHQLEIQRGIFEFCEIPYDDELGRNIAQRTAFDRHGATGESSFRRLGRAGDWVTTLRPIESLAFVLAAGDLLIQLGYEADRRWPFRGLGDNARRAAAQ